MGSITEAKPFGGDRRKRGRRTWEDVWMMDETSLSSAAFTRALNVLI